MSVVFIARIAGSWKSGKMSGRDLIFRPALEKVKQKVKVTYDSSKLLKCILHNPNKLTE